MGAMRTGDPLADFCGGVDEDRRLYRYILSVVEDGGKQEAEYRWGVVSQLVRHITKYHGESLDTPVAMG